MEKPIKFLFTDDELNKMPDLEFKKYIHNNNYLISNYGHVISLYSLNPKRISYCLENGYIRYRLQLTNGVKHNMYGHRLVAIMFLNNSLDLQNKVVNHLDCNRSNNYYKNLEICSQRENSIHSYFIKNTNKSLFEINSIIKNNKHKEVNKNSSTKKQIEEKIFNIIAVKSCLIYKIKKNNGVTTLNCLIFKKDGTKLVVSLRMKFKTNSNIYISSTKKFITKYNYLNNELMKRFNYIENLLKTLVYYDIDITSKAISKEFKKYFEKIEVY